MTHHYTFLAALFVLLPAGGERTYGMDDLERALKAEQEALDSLKVELETDRKRLERKLVQRQSVTEALNRSEQEVLQIRGELRNLARREKVLAGRVGATREELAAVEGRLRAREDDMALRLREIYKLARGGQDAGSFFWRFVCGCT